MSTDLIVELPVDRLEWEMANPRQKKIIIRELYQEMFGRAVELCRERSRRPTSFTGRMEFIDVEKSGIIVDPTADPATIIVARQRFTTEEVPSAPSSS